MIENRETVVLYTTATCNLNCVYCYIDKNKALVEIDNILDESFKGDYYEKFILEMFPDPNQLKTLETWGGEPFLRMDRIYNTLERIIPKYPNLAGFFASTNMAFDQWNEQFFGLMKIFGHFPRRIFNYCLQVSLDGPEEFTDMTRGNGTTNKILDNYEKMLGLLTEILPPNVNLLIQFKPTLDINTVRMLNSKNAIIEYYMIFDKLIDRLRKLNRSNISIGEGIPNLACPSLATKEDGIFFANLCQTTRMIEKDIGRYLLYYKNITPFSNGAMGDVNLTLKHKNFTCGTGYTTIGFLPNEMVSSCHNGFVDIVSNYKKFANANDGRSTIDAKIFLSEQKHRMIFHKNDYNKYENQMACFNCEGTSARVATIATQLVLLAHAGQVLPLYKDDVEAIKAAIFYQSHTAFCVRDNHATTGSLTMIHNGMLKFLFNGAHQLLEDKNSINWVK